MYYNLENLEEKLKNFCVKSNLDRNFINNPAFEDVLSKIRNILFSELSVIDPKKVFIKEEDGKILLSGILDGNYYLCISILDSKSIQCIVSSKKPSFEKEGKMVQNKSICEIKSSWDDKQVITSLNLCVLDDYLCQQNNCYGSSVAFKETYDKDGVMTCKEKKVYPRRIILDNINSTAIDSALFVSRQAFNIGSQYRNDYRQFDFMRRDKFDTAYRVYEDKDLSINYRAIVPLDQRNGLMKMYEKNTSEDLFQKDIYIPPLSNEEIERIINNEKNSKVANGLRKYATNRNNYFYSSIDDKNFLFEEKNNIKGISNK